MVTVPPGTARTDTPGRITAASGKTRPGHGHPAWQATGNRDEGDRVSTAVRELTVAVHPDVDQVIQRVLRHTPKREQTWSAGGQTFTEYC
jgi:hypothetical protein